MVGGRGGGMGGLGLDVLCFAARMAGVERGAGSRGGIQQHATSHDLLLVVSG